MKLKPLIIAAFCSALLPRNVTCQIFRDSEKFNFGLAVKLNLGIAGKRMSFYNLSVAAGLSRNFQNDKLNILPGGQVSVNYCSKSRFV